MIFVLNQGRLVEKGAEPGFDIKNMNKHVFIQSL